MRNVNIRTSGLSRVVKSINLGEYGTFTPAQALDIAPYKPTPRPRLDPHFPPEPKQPPPPTDDSFHRAVHNGDYVVPEHLIVKDNKLEINRHGTIHKNGYKGNATGAARGRSSYISFKMKVPHKSKREDSVNYQVIDLMVMTFLLERELATFENYFIRYKDGANKGSTNFEDFDVRPVVECKFPPWVDQNFHGHYFLDAQFNVSGKNKSLAKRLPMEVKQTKSAVINLHVRDKDRDINQYTGILHHELAKFNFWDSQDDDWSLLFDGDGDNITPENMDVFSHEEIVRFFQSFLLEVTGQQFEHFREIIRGQWHYFDDYLVAGAPGMVFSLKTFTILESAPVDGYEHVTLNCNCHSDGDGVIRLAVHRMVAFQFLPFPKDSNSDVVPHDRLPEFLKDYVVDHKNSVKADNFTSNLQWKKKEDDFFDQKPGVPACGEEESFIVLKQEEDSIADNWLLVTRYQGKPLLEPFYLNKARNGAKKRFGDTIPLWLMWNGYVKLFVTLAEKNKAGKSVQKFVSYHRLIYEFRHGKIGTGLFIDHLNRVRHDNRLENLEAVTPRVNSQRAIGQKVLVKGVDGKGVEASKTYGSLAELKGCLFHNAAPRKTDNRKRKVKGTHGGIYLYGLVSKWKKRQEVRKEFDPEDVITIEGVLWGGAPFPSVTLEIQDCYFYSRDGKKQMAVDEEVEMIEEEVDNSNDNSSDEDEVVVTKVQKCSH